MVINEKYKKSQFQIGFGMIFSIILIVMFLVVAFIAIKAFLGTKCSVEQGIFIKDLQDEIDLIWKGAGASEIFKGEIFECEISHVCFFNLNGNYEENNPKVKDFKIFTGENENHNLYFYPRSKAKLGSALIKHVNMTELSENPKCYQMQNNEFQIKLEKNLNEGLVRIS